MKRILFVIGLISLSGCESKNLQKYTELQGEYSVLQGEHLALQKQYLATLDKYKKELITGQLKSLAAMADRLFMIRVVGMINSGELNASAKAKRTLNELIVNSTTLSDSLLRQMGK